MLLHLNALVQDMWRWWFTDLWIMSISRIMLSLALFTQHTLLFNSIIIVELKWIKPQKSLV